MTSNILRRYDREGEYFKGTFGICYVVKDQHENDKKKVLKEIKCKDFDNLEIKLAEVREEATLMYKLDHPFIVRLLDYFTNKEIFYLLIEYCELGDLSVHLSKLRRQKQLLPLEDVMNWFVQLLSGVKYIHSKKIIHRDLKPANIFLKKSSYDEKTNIKIGDLGWSKHLLHTISLAKTLEAGALSYMGPELLQKKPYDNKLDIWSLACILYEMCIGDAFFIGRNENEIERKILSGVIGDIKALRSSTDENEKYLINELDSIYKRMMKLSFDERPSAKEILNEPLLKKHIKEQIKSQLEKQKPPSRAAMNVKAIKLLSSYSTALDSDDDGDFESFMETNQTVSHSNTNENNEMLKLARRLSKWKIKNIYNIHKVENDITVTDTKNWLERSGGLSDSLCKELIVNLEKKDWPTGFEEKMESYIVVSGIMFKTNIVA